jgi:hypothetical protein
LRWLALAELAKKPLARDFRNIDPRLARVTYRASTSATLREGAALARGARRRGAARRDGDGLHCGRRGDRQRAHRESHHRLGSRCAHLSRRPMARLRTCSSSATSPMCRKRTAPTFLTVAASRRLKAVRGPAQLPPTRGGGRKKTTTRRERVAQSRSRIVLHSNIPCG